MIYKIAMQENAIGINRFQWIVNLKFMKQFCPLIFEAKKISRILWIMVKIRIKIETYLFISNPIITPPFLFHGLSIKITKANYRKHNEENPESTMKEKIIPITKPNFTNLHCNHWTEQTISNNYQRNVVKNNWGPTGSLIRSKFSFLPVQ